MNPVKIGSVYFTKKKAILIDLDGVASNNDWRNRMLNGLEVKPGYTYRYNLCQIFDKPNEWCLEIMEVFKKAKYEIIIVSGKTDDLEEETKEWLAKYNVQYDHLYMKSNYNKVHSNEFKKSLYENVIKGVFDVLFVIDDRKSNVKTWRDLGLTCFQNIDNNT